MGFQVVFQAKMCSIESGPSSTMLETEVSRLVRLRPEEVCHIPRALDFFLTKVGMLPDSLKLDN